MAKAEPILYLSNRDLEQLGVSLGEIVPILEEMLRRKANGGTVQPPKIFFHRGGPRFYSAMVREARHAASCLGSVALARAGARRQRGQPFLYNRKGIEDVWRIERIRRDHMMAT